MPSEDMTSLERIEARHKRYQRLASSPAVAVHEDVVKLARAHQKIIDHPMPTLNVDELVKVLAEVVDISRRTLREVAGGSDDRR